MMKIIIRNIFLKLILIIQKNYLVFIKIYYFYPKKKVEKVEKFICSIEDKEKYVIHVRALKKSIKSWFKIKTGMQNNSV